MKIEKLEGFYAHREGDMFDKINELIDAHNREEKPTASKCNCKYPTDRDPIGRWNPNCPVHAPHETPQKLEEFVVNQEDDHKECGVHETPTKTCTCPHCDNWRCDHKN